MLKLGTCLYNFLWSHSLPDAIRLAARLGFDAVEAMAVAPQLDLRSFDSAARDVIAAALDETGVQIFSLNPTFVDLNLASRNDVFRRETIIEIKACIDVAAALGAQLVVIGPGRRHPLALEPLELMDRLARPGIAECVEYAAERGVTYGFENINGGYLARSEEIAAFIDEMDNPFCRAVYDVANASYVEDPVVGVRTLGHRIAHVHVSDTDGSTRAHWPIGMGSIDFAGIASALSEIVYTGWSFLETTWMDDPHWAVASSADSLEQLGWRRLRRPVL